MALNSLHQNLIYWLFPTAALEQSLRAIWDAASWAAVLILPPIKLHSQLSSCTFFFSLTMAISNPKTWCCQSVALNMSANLENSAVATGLDKVSFYSSPKERQCQRMLKLPDNCTHLTRYQSNAQSSPSQAPKVHEPWTSRCSSWV